MAAPYPPKAVANAFLQRAFNGKKSIDHLKLQKLVFLAHGYYLATNGVPLLDEPVEAWNYGPTCRQLYDAFREFGHQPITALALDLDWETVTERPVPAPEEDRSARRIIDFVFKTYIEAPSLALSELCRRPGWAWDETRKNDKFNLRHVDIDNSLIKRDFEPFVTSPAPADVAA
jgi:uncharacterized phage-associated protein